MYRTRRCKTEELNGQVSVPSLCTGRMFGVLGQETLDKERFQRRGIEPYRSRLAERTDQPDHLRKIITFFIGEEILCSDYAIDRHPQPPTISSSNTRPSAENRIS